jgi:16S rRNA (adenine1518-N6/adenine1519-N6)-dimethyltransferase
MAFRFKKKLGQHFLKDKKILEKISSIKKIQNKVVVEVGPGKGSLTRMILEKNPKKLFVIEKDKTLEQYLLKLKERYPENLEIIFEDALKINFSRFKKNKILLIANLPYNIASTLIIGWIKNLGIFHSIIVMVQKEVADRLSAKVSSKSYGRTSVLVQLHSQIIKKFDVSPEKFFPQPKVLSSVIEITPKKKLDFDYQHLDAILKDSFRQRRKTIKNNLKDFYEDSEKKMIDCGINPSLRPQDIEPKKYLKLADLLV